MKKSTSLRISDEKFVDSNVVNGAGTLSPCIKSIANESNEKDYYNTEREHIQKAENTEQITIKEKKETCFITGMVQHKRAPR